MKSLIRTSVLIGAALIITGCGKSAGLYQPIVDSPKDKKYHSDLTQCQQLAAERSYLNDDVKSSTMLGTGIGTVAGAIEGGVEGAIGGAVVGGVLSGGAKSWSTRTDKRNIIIECMKLRNHRVVKSTYPSA